MSEKRIVRDIVRDIITSLTVFLLVGLCINSGLAYEQKTCSLQITLNASCIPLLNYQSISPVSVSFELKNLGNETFSGTLTLSANTDKHLYDAITFNVTNLATNETYSNSSSYSTPDEGNYFFTLEIVSNDFSNIKLYQGSNMITEGIRVHINTSISLHSFTEFIAIVAIVVTIILAIVGFAIERKRRKKR